MLPKHMICNSKEFPYKCDIFYTIVSLSLSYIRRFSLQLKVMCDICGYASVFKTNLEIHKIQHIGDCRFTIEESDEDSYSRIDLSGQGLRSTSVRFVWKEFCQKQNFVLYCHINSQKRNKVIPLQHMLEVFPVHNKLLSHMRLHTRS